MPVERRLVLLAAVAVIAAILDRRGRGCAASASARSCVLTAIFSITGYVVGRCGAIDFYYMRYELLSVSASPVSPDGSSRVGRRRAPPRLWLALRARRGSSLTAVPHAQLWDEYLRQPAGGHPADADRASRRTRRPLRSVAATGSPTRSRS